jgi:hypothetical protein
MLETLSRWFNTQKVSLETPKLLVHPENPGDQRGPLSAQVPISRAENNNGNRRDRMPLSLCPF